MKSIEAVKRLHYWSERGSFLFRTRDLGLIFEERGETLRSTMKRLVSAGVIGKIHHDCYMYELAHLKGVDVLRSIAVFLKPGEFTYESLESAASRWGFISQIPVSQLQCVTTGSAGLAATRFGEIEYVHTDDSLNRCYTETIDNGILRLATKERCLADLVSRGRSMDLIDWEELEEDD